MQPTGAQNRQHFGELYVLLGAILWGTTGTAQAFANPAAQPVTIGASRLLVGGLVLLIPVLVQGGGGRLFQPLPLFLVAAISSLLYQVTFFSAVKITGVAIGTIVGIGSSPVFAGILGWLIRGERPGRRWWPATMLSIIGIVLVGLESESGNVSLVGIFLALAAGLSYAVLAVAMKNILQQKNDPLSVTCGIFVLAGMLSLPVFFFYDISWIKEADGFGVVVYLGAVTGALAYYLFNSGLRHVHVATAGTLTMGEPMTAGLLGVLVLGERLSTVGWLGIVLLTGGLLLLTLPAQWGRWLAHALAKKGIGRG
ncbi:MAG: EamA family transporter [Thermodesulfobacteriota bacterium]